MRTVSTPGSRAALFLLGGLWLLLTPQNSLAQRWRWAVNNSPNTGTYAITSTAADAAGHLFVTGVYNTATTLGTHNLPAPQDYDAFVAMADSNGVWQWVVPLQGTGENGLGDLSLADPTAIYVTGRAPGAATLGGVALPAGADRSFVARLSRQGALQWTWRGPDFKSMAATATGKVYVAGDFNTPSMTIGPLTVQNTFTSPLGTATVDLYIAELSATGVCQWAIAAGGPDDQLNPYLATDAAGNVLVSGWCQNDYANDTLQANFGAIATTKPVIDPQAQGVFVAKLSPAHQWQWALLGTAGAGEQNAFGFGLTTDAARNVYVSGAYENTSFTIGGTSITNPQNGGSAGDAAGFLLKVSPIGQVRWLASTHNAGRCYASSTAVDAHGTVYVNGWLPDSDTLYLGAQTVAPFSPQSAQPNTFTAALDSSGHWRWGLGYGANASPITVDAQRRVTVGGYYTGPTTFGAVSLPGPAGLCLAQLGTPALVNTFLPRAGRAGTQVRLTGLGFRGATGVLFGGVAAGAFQVVSDSVLLVTVPTGLTPASVLIRVVGPNGAGQSLGRFNVTPTGLPSTSATVTLVLTPNPARESVAVQGGRPGADVLVRDALGRPCVTTRLDATGAAVLRLDALPAGLYVVQSGGVVRRLLRE